MATAQPYISVQLIKDSDAEDPRNWDNLASMVCDHRRYILGEEDGATEALELIYKSLSEKQLEDLGFNSTHVPDIQQALEMTGLAIILPLYLYDHSGITMRTTKFSCPWDSGQVGFIYVSKEKVCAEFGWKRLSKGRTEKIRSIMVGEVEVYDQYLTGDVWGFRVSEDGRETDCCWGFYGSDPLSNGVLDHLADQAKQLVQAGLYQRLY